MLVVAQSLLVTTRRDWLSKICDLVLSRVIRDQTLNALQLAGPLTLLDLEQAQSLTYTALDTLTTAILANCL